MTTENKDKTERLLFQRFQWSDDYAEKLQGGITIKALVNWMNWTN